jgi:23S rRNA (uridine2552-2'-O)-methyltransferase
MAVRRDHYFHRAKQEDYLARSVYKLKEIDNRYRLTKKGMKALDIGCVPGSWSQYLLEKAGNGTVVGIDIAGPPDIRDGRFNYMKADVCSIEGDLLKENAGVFDLVVSDACPNTSGSKFMDAQKSMEIVRNVFRLSETVLKDGGCVVAKVLAGEDTGEFVRGLGPKFETVRMSKPKASKKESRETYIVALRKRSMT